jgi:hypothetical protein
MNVTLFRERVFTDVIGRRISCDHLGFRVGLPSSNDRHPWERRER